MKAFELYVPPGWTRIDLAGDPDEAVRRFVSRTARTAPPSRQPALRALLEANLAPRLRAFAEQGVACVLVPAGSANEDPVRPVVVVRSLDTGELDPLVLLQSVAGEDPSARLVDLAEMVAVRTESLVDATATAEAAEPVLAAVRAVPGVARDVAPGPEEAGAGDGGLRLLSARVRYLMGVPDDPERWVDVQCAIDHPSSPEATQLAGELVDLVDAVVQTFRWVS